ncbi:MAG TPA: glycosyltransferase [Herpetosiphonaceae bacterium]|nr:glycosyltransferase [Herpetosiphonaceae bacterium]
MHKPKVAILAAATGGGHLSLTRALEEMLSPRYTVETIVEPYLRLLHQYYTVVDRYWLASWGVTYRRSDQEQSARRVHRLLDVLLRKSLRTRIAQAQPRMIITTHTLLSYATARAIADFTPRIPFVFQLSELGAVHATWLTLKRAAAYLVPTYEIYAQARASNIEAGRLHLTGLPVRQQFLQDYSTCRTETLAELGFDPGVFTAFVQGGGEGAAGISRTVEGLLAANQPVQMIFAAGTNKHLAARFSGIEQLRVLPFTEKLAPYIAAADVVIGKAGPNSIAEAVMLGKPFVATTCIPGQETPNLEFLERHNLGWVGVETSRLQQILAQIVRDPSALAARARSVQAYRAWNLQAIQQTGAVIDALI